MPVVSFAAVVSGAGVGATVCVPEAVVSVDVFEVVLAGQPVNTNAENTKMQITKKGFL